MMRAMRWRSALVGLCFLGGLAAAADPPRPATVAEAVRQLDDPEASIRRRAALRLAELDDANAAVVAALGKALDDEDDDVRLAAAAGLWRIKRDPAALEAVVSVLRDGGLQSRREAAVLVGSFGKAARDAVPDLVALHAAVPSTAPQVRRSLVAVGPAGLEKLLPLLTSETPLASRILVCEVVTGLGPSAKEAAPAMVKLLKEGSLRTEAARALGAIGPDALAAVPLLVPLLKNEDRELRRTALTSLGRIGPGAKDALPEMIALLPGEDGEVASRALSLVGEDAVPELAKAADDERPGVRRLAVRALGATAAASAASRDRVVKSLGDASREVRAEAVESLGRVVPTPPEAGPALVALLAEDLGPEGRRRLAERVGGLDAAALARLPADGRGKLLAALADEDALVRYPLALSAGKMKAAAGEAVPALSRLLADPEPRVRYAAAYGLGRLGPAAKEAIPALRKALDDPEPTVRSRAAASLKQVEPTD